MSENTQTDDISAVRSCEIVLGERVYMVREASRLRARKFWPIVTEQLKPIADAIAQAGELSEDSDLKDIAQLAPMVERIILDGPDAVLEALCAYDSGLEAARTAIEATATDRQLVRALLRLLEMSDPFGVRGLATRGLTLMARSSNSQSQNGG